MIGRVRPWYREGSTEGCQSRGVDVMVLNQAFVARQRTLAEEKMLLSY